ncbi:hemagglutinin [Pseudomonas frederiksbergensis]|uniref:Hemagglutinin n=3 Tax=Pseudomonas TaxID=286 RepID=A0A2S8HW10_9PSED|nr:hemagglutinin repeat-containing protein [Pseudomonas frederiksbergensis]PQP06661.1 hemagglutinin [Pseudomonas frederiksbergensis]
MDVRHYAFLAGQPSAAVKNREHFWGMPKRGLAFLLANVMFWQPMWAQADGIVVATPGTSLGQAGNGVPIIQIATPNGTGLSHNQFHDYNVGTQGVILNNVANQTGATQLGGIIVGNPNLTSGVAAQTILNEVVGGSPSQLRGYTEVAGQSARVIVANPYGISCNGCGFINTPRVTLTTGKPVLDNGRLDRFQVDQGSVTIDGAGLNANNVDRFEIITRSAKINAEIQAKNLTIIAGRNDVNADSLNATARADDGSAKPQLAIDSSALGGMYAGAIKLVGTEAGVGVKLDGNLAASGGDIQLDANGHLSLAQTSAAGAVNVKAASLDARGPVYAGTAVNVQTQGNLTNQQTLAARDSIALTAGGVLTNNGVIEAGVNADTSRNATGDVSLSAQNFNNTGKSVVASRNLTVNTSQTLSNQGGTLSAGQTTNITVGTLDNQNNGRVLSSGTLNVTANQVFNTNGVINSTGNLTSTIGQLNNSNGELTSLANATLNMASLDNVAGLVMAGRLLDITASGTINNIGGTLAGKNALTVRAQNLDNSQQGELSSEGQLTTRVSGLLNNQNKGLIQANGVMDVQATRLDNREGKISSLNTLTVSSSNADNRAGVIRADQAVKLLVTEMDNRDKGRLESKAALTFDGNKLDNRNGGWLTASGLMSLKAKEVANDAGRISSQGDVEANIDSLSQQGGELVAEGHLKLSGKTLDNQKNGLVASLKSLTVNVEQVDNRGGSLSSQADMQVNGKSLNNSDGGKVLSDTTLALKVDQIINQTAGLIFSKGASTLNGIGLNNVAGKIVSQNNLVLTFDNAMDNQQGLISSEGTLTLTAGTLDNRLGKLSSLEAMALTTTSALQNQGGLIASQKGLTLVSGSLDNSDKGIVSAKAASNVTTGEFNNSKGGSLATDGTLDLTTKHLDNSAGQIGSQQKLNVSVTSLDQDDGELFSNSDLTLDLNNGLLNNQRGNLHTPGLLLLKNLNEVNNSSGEISGAKAYSLTAQSLNNDGGKLLSNEKLTLVIDRALSNVKGLIASAGLDSRSASLNNAGGEIRGRGEVDLTVTDAFDNQAGVVIADDGLTVKAASLDNRQEGLVGATKALKLIVDDIDNRNGELSSKADVTLIGQQLDNSDAGYILAGGNLALTVDKVINRNKGLLSGDAGLTLTGQTLENSGRLTTLNNLTANLTSDLDNNQGSLVSEGELAIHARSLSNNGGTISSAKVLTVDSKGAVSNQGGKLLTDSTLTLTSTGLDNQQQGAISSKGGMNITTGALNNSQASIYAGDRLDLSAGQVTNTGGSIGAATALVADVSALDQQGGKLFSKGTLSLDVNGGALNNQDGFINSPGQLLLKNLAGVNNRNGEISSEEAFDLVAKQLDNNDGRLLSNQKLTLRIDSALTSIKGKIAAAALQVRAASLDNSGGILLSDAGLEVTVDGQLINQNKGLIKAAQQLTLNSNGLDNQGGTLLGGTGLSIDLGAAPADLSNQNGLINTKGVLSIAHLRDLNNQKGEISSVNSFSLTGNSLDNRGGNLISNDQLTLNATSLNNQGGLISGWNKLAVAGGSLDNSLEGTLSSLLGNLNIDLSGALINNAKGGLAGKGDVTITAASLDNSNGIVTSGGKQTLTMTQGAINNASSGLIESSGTLDISAASLNNASGNVTANKALTFTGTSLDNSNGSLVGADSVTLDLLGALTNIKGELGSTGLLVIKRSSSIDNQGGQLISQGLLSLLTGNLNNSQEGTVAANGQLDLTATGSVRNDAGGLISSRDAGLNVKAASLNNAGGALQSQGALTLDVKGGAIDNQGGKVIAQNGELNITAASLDSRAGVLSSLKGLLQTRLTGVLRNGLGGKIEGNRLDLQALGGIYSDGGRIAANTGNILLNAGNAAIDNSNGGIYAKGLVKVIGGSLNNNAGKISGEGIDLGLDGNLTNRGGLIESAATLAVRASSLDNQGGKLRALGGVGKTNFQIGSLFDNRNGLVETANTDLTLAAPSFLNAGGTVTHVGAGEFDISTANVMNAGGSLVTRGGLTLNADSWTNSSVIQAGRLRVNVNNLVQTAGGQLLGSDSFVGSGVNWSNEGLLASNGTFSLDLSGAYGGNGRVSSVGNLGLMASQIDLTAAASITGASASTVTSRGSLNNFGRITSADSLTVNAASLTNSGTLGAAGNLRISSNSLLNQNGLIFSGRDMALRVGTLTNRYADIYGLGNISIARDDSNGWSSSINNISATIESVGDLTLAADHIENRKDVFEVTGGKLVSGAIGVRCHSCSSFGDFSNTQSSGYLVWVENYQSQIIQDSASASLTAGRNFTGNGRELLNNASTISAGNDLSLNLQNFTNQGAAVGDYSIRRSFSAPDTEVKDLPRWREIMSYNAANDPSYDVGPLVYREGRLVSPNLHVWNSEGVESLTRVRSRSTGGEANSYIAFGSIWVETVAGNGFGFMPASYSDGVRTEAPDFVKNAAFSDNTITYSSPSSYANAVVQAGGKAYINATQNLTNSVVRDGVAAGAGASRLGSTQLAGQVTPTVISINSQLPPDLAQQQVNPLTLPGFTLPTGNNGLFRLSGQGGTEQTIVPGQSWTIGSVTAATTQRSDGMPVRQATELQFDKNDPVSVKKRDLALASRPSVSLNDKTVQVSVNPATGGGPVGVLLPNSGNVSFNVPRVQGLPDTSVRSNPHKYLIETNPVLTNLKQFMSSDYLLANLGYNPDTSAKRLGDGLFEQRLIQQSIVARTGQRFIDGQTSDEAMFKYLMNNAIASKDQLNLSMGVTLTSQQVAALTHDIVWLEEHVVNGEKVLVPVLYLAQANNRLAPNGALIQGGDVTLIAGQDLNNAGTLRATNNLSAEAGNDLTNTGLIEAGDRLTLKAGNNIVNKSGGIISGRDVTLTATNGDVINQRDVTGVDVRRGGSLQHRDYLDNAARIEAANDLSINAGRDVNNIGGVLQSGRDLELDAGRDVNITSVQDRSTNARGSNFLNQTITQHAAEVTSGRDLSISADRDVAIVASRLDAKRDIGVNAGNDIVITSAANESDYVSRSKKSAQETHSTTQQSSVLNAGRDIALNAGNDLGIIASRVKAQEDISLDAVQDITVASAKDESSSYYYKKKKGSFGRSSTIQKESYDSTNVASVIDAGHDLTVNSSKDGDGGVSLDGGRNVTIIGSQLKAGNDLVLGATNDVAILSATEETGDYSKKTKTGLFGMSSSGKSQLQTTVTQIGSELNAGQDAVILAGRDVRLNASEVSAKNDAELHAGLADKTGDITLSSSDDLAYSRAEEYKKKVGLTLKDAIGWAVGTPSFGGDITFNTSHKEGREVVSSNSVGSQVNAGNDAILNAARDINIIGSGISADNSVKLDAGRDVNVVASTDQQRSNSWETDKSFGLKQTADNNGYTTFVGNETKKHGVDSSGYSAAGSSIDAGLNLSVNAGRDINQQGSDLHAENNIKLKAGHNINIDAAEEASVVTTRDSVKRTGSTTTVAYNFGNTVDSLKGTGKGEDGVSKGSSVLKSVDALGSFFSGPTFDGHIGSSSTSQTHTQTSITNRPSSLSAGGDITLDAENDVNVKGSKFDAGRDINVTGRNITFDVAKGAENNEDNQTQSKGGIKGGTTGGFKLGVGISNAGNQGESSQGTSTATQLNAGGSVKLDAKNDLTLVATQVTAERDIKLKAGNDLNVLSAQNASTSENDRRSWGAEGGIILGKDGFGIYGSANIGIGDLNREGVKQQEAYLYAGNNLSFESGRDTTIAGATLHGDEVTGDVGRNLTVSSVPDTVKARGQELDLSITGSFYGASGSVGYGKTTGQTNWVENQTVINGTNKVDIRTEGHTQIDGAVLSADNGNLKLDTDTLGFRNIYGKDNEHGYYLNVSGSYGSESNSQADKPNKGMEGPKKSSWAVEGYNYEKDRDQVLRATVGSGDIIVRHDKVTGADSTSGLNRNVDQAYEVTRDDEHRTDLYASSTSISAVMDSKKTLDKWSDQVAAYGENSIESLNVLTDLFFGTGLIAAGYGFVNADKLQLHRVYLRQLGSKDEGLRRALVTTAINDITGGEDSAETRALISQLVELAGRDPAQANAMLVLLGNLGGSDSETGQYKYVHVSAAVVVAVAGVVAALGAALVASQNSSQNQENLRVAANAVVEEMQKAGYTVQQQMKLSIELWESVTGTAFPIHLLDKKYQVLITLAVDNNVGHPVSVGGQEVQPSLPTSTDGSQIDNSGGWSTTSPAVDPNLSPGIMFSNPVDILHIIGADYDRDGNPTGAHTLLNGDVRIVPGSQSAPDASGVYRATVQVPDPKNPGQWLTKTTNNSINTMFPASWTKAQLIDEIDGAWNSPRKVVNGSRWTSWTPSGVKVTGYTSPRATVYPLYKP